MRIERALDASRAAVNRDHAAVGPRGACQDACEGALSRAVLADERVNFTGTYLESRAPQRCDSTVIFRDTIREQERGHQPILMGGRGRADDGWVALDFRGGAGQALARREPVFDQGPQRLETVARANLLALGNPASVVADRYFLDRVAQSP